MPSRKTTKLLLQGSVAPGFEEVASEFEKNFSRRGDLGAACAVYREGEMVVDLWGGYRNARTAAPWEENTLALVFSTTKGLAAMTVAVAHSRGLLNYDEHVVAYWPEFAVHGKERITVRQLLSHQAGLCVITERLYPHTLADLDELAKILARQKPCWEPGTKHGYHVLSLGWYEGELIRRVDPKHRSLGQFFQEEVAQPLGVEFYIGTPSCIPDSRIATIRMCSPIQVLSHLSSIPWRLAFALLNPRSLSTRAYANPRLYRPSDLGNRDLRSLEIPAANGIGQVRSIAKAYGVFAVGGSELELAPKTIAALTSPATPPSMGPYDEVLRLDTSFSLGYVKPSPYFSFGSSDRAFGMPGLGGSFGYADPDARLGFAYATNRLGVSMWNDSRQKALRAALHRCLSIPRNGSRISNG